MTMKKKFFVALTAIVASVTIAVGSVLATVAYLTSSAAVSNVFTIGNVSMTMTESKVDINGVKTDNGATQVDTNTYKLVPNKTYAKDPGIHVAQGSEACYLFVLVRNDLEKIEAGYNAENPAEPLVIENKLTIGQQLLNNGWKPYTTASTGTVYLYYGNSQTPTPTEANQNYKLFDYFAIDEHADVSVYGAAKITLTAVAIQTAGFGEVGSAEALTNAWNAVVATYPYIKTGETGGSSSSPQN